MTRYCWYRGPNFRLGLCGLFLMFGPTVFALLTTLILCVAIRTFPESVVVMQLVRFGLMVILCSTAAHGYAFLASLGPVLIILAIWRAWRDRASSDGQTAFQFSNSIDISCDRVVSLSCGNSER